MADEFAIIERYFGNIGKPADSIALDIGDDAAVVDLPAGHQLAVAMDTLVAGVHFPINTDPADIAYKALAVNLSDLAAMAAKPAWFLLSLTLADSDEAWLSGFADGLKQAADCYGLRLVGGDTCRGQLSISIQIAGLVPNGRFVTRGGALPGDIILVSGELGNAALGLAHKKGQVELPDVLAHKCEAALNRPQPRLELSGFLREFADAAIDISDGLVGDLKHILDASGCGAELKQDAIPVDRWIRRQNAWGYALDAGDDYEICCCVPACYDVQIESWNRENPECRLMPIGRITESGYYLRTGGQRLDLTRRQGYRHFA